LDLSKIIPSILVILTVASSLMYEIFFIIEEITLFTIPGNLISVFMVSIVILVIYIIFNLPKFVLKLEKNSMPNFIMNCVYIFLIIGIIGYHFFREFASLSPGLWLIFFNCLLGYWLINNFKRILSWISSDSKNIKKVKGLFQGFSLVFIIISVVSPILIDRLHIRNNCYSVIQYNSDSSGTESELIYSLETTNISKLFDVDLSIYPEFDSLDVLKDFYIDAVKTEALLLTWLYYHKIFEYIVDIEEFETGLQLHYINYSDSQEYRMYGPSDTKNATEIYIYSPENETLFDWDESSYSIFDYKVFVNLTYDPSLENQSMILFDYPVKLVSIYYDYDHLFGNLGGLSIKKNMWFVVDIDLNILCGIFQDRGIVVA